MTVPQVYAHLFTSLTYVYISKLESDIVSNCLMRFCLRFIELKKVCAIIIVIIQVLNITKLY